MEPTKQSRAAQIRYEADEKGKKVATKGHGRSGINMQYDLVEGDSREITVWM